MPTWDEPKRVENLRKHRMDLAGEFDFDTAVAEQDHNIRHETRFRAVGWFRDRLCVLIYVPHEAGDDFHAISLRPAEPKERRRYAEDV